MSQLELVEMLGILQECISKFKNGI